MLIAEPVSRPLLGLGLSGPSLRPLRLPAHTVAECSGFGFRVLIPRSSSKVRVHGFAAFVANPCHAILLGPDDRIDREAIGDERFVADAITLPPALLRPLLGEDANTALRGGRFPQPWARLSAKQYLSLRLYARAEASEGRTEALTWWARSVLQQARGDWRRRAVPLQSGEPPRPRGRFELAQEVAGFIDAHWREPVSLALLAEQFQLSSFYLLRAFRRAIGLTPHQYLLQLRLRRSLDAIEANEQRIADVARSLGFSSHGHFSTAFRASFGITPADYSCRRIERATASAAATAESSVGLMV